MIENAKHTFLRLVKEAPAIRYDGERYVLPAADKNIVSSLGFDYVEFGDILQLRVKSFFEGGTVKYYEALESELRPGELNSSMLIISASGFLVEYKPGLQLAVEGKCEVGALEKIRNLIS